tara:strand:+ start:50 stop:208 length:159 start_codon:yes stop_codon:yes gene_type:complete
MTTSFTEKELFYILLKKLHKGESFSDTKIFVEDEKYWDRIINSLEDKDGRYI